LSVINEVFLLCAGRVTLAAGVSIVFGEQIIFTRRRENRANENNKEERLLAASR
jgi:hypothetical protein